MKVNPILITSGEKETFALLDTILQQMYNNEHIFDSIIVLIDSSKDYSTTSFKEELSKKLSDISNVKIVEEPLQGDFSKFRNKALEYVPDDNLVAWLDADETINENFFVTCYILFKSNPQLDMALLTRANYVEGLTEDHVRKWGWTVDQFGRVNYPDLQGRCHIKRNDIKWNGHVHEKLINFKSYGTFDGELELLHIKHISRQEKQNELYDKL